jgi:CDGSH-type Zn-finger protein
MSEATRITITPTDNGPYHIEGPVAFVDTEGNVISTETDLWLCRCGNSAEKPYCDGSHRRVGFQDVVRAPEHTT